MSRSGDWDAGYFTVIHLKGQRFSSNDEVKLWIIGMNNQLEMCLDVVLLHRLEFSRRALQNATRSRGGFEL